MLGAPAKAKARRASKPVALKAKAAKPKATSAKAKTKVSAKVSAKAKTNACNVNFSTKRKRTPIRSHRPQVVQTPPPVSSPTPAPCLTCSNNLLEVAHSFTGLRYRRGGSSPETGFDCSGFVKYVFQTAQDMLLPRSASQQFTQGTEVAREELAQGDLVFFRRGRASWHVGIYNGDGNFIHSPNSRESIKLTSLDTPYYKRHYIGARRISTAAAPSANLPLLAAQLHVPVLPPPPEFLEAASDDQR